MLFQVPLDINLAEEAQKTGQLENYTAAASGGQLLADWIGGLLSLVMVIASLALLLNLVWGALTWVTSGGEKGKLDEARQRMTNSVIGIVILSSVLVIFMMVQYFLGIEVLNFGGAGGSAPVSCGPGLNFDAALNACCPAGGGACIPV